MATRLCIIAACVAAACVCHAAGAGDIGAPFTARDPNPFAAYRAEAVAPFFEAARNRRVDMAIIGDSNTRSAMTSGHEDGMARAFAARLGCYATRVDPIGGWGAWGTEIFESSSFLIGYQSSGAPAPLLRALGDLPLDAGFPAGYAYLPHGAGVSWIINTGVGINAGHPIDITGTLRWHFTVYHWPAAAGSDLGFVSPSARELWPGSAYTLFASSSVTTSGPGVPGRRDHALSVPAGDRGEHGILFCLTDFPNQRGARGPFLSRWTRVENLATTRGIAYSPLLYQGGRTCRDAALSLLDRADQTRMTEWFRQVTRLQNGPPTLLVQIVHGGNDANWTIPAVVYERGMARPPGGGWPAGAPTNSVEGMRQNFQSVINIMRDYWVGAGHDERNLYFLVGSYHPQPPYWNETQPGAGDGWQWNIVQHDATRAWRQICDANANVAMLNGYHVSTPQEFTANGWYADGSYPGGDQAHLSIEGYRAWGEACAEALLRACDCGPSVDFDYDGQRGPSDLFVFLNAWFAGEARADFDRSGGAPSPLDVFAFLNAWFAGCAGH